MFEESSFYQIVILNHVFPELTGLFLPVSRRQCFFIFLCLFQRTFPTSDPSVSTIQRQRRELQLLMAELKDRDRELNTMAASHHRQLHAWEQDRQRVLTLEQKCSGLDGKETLFI